MLRFLLKMMLMAWIGSVLLLLAMLNLGKTAPEISSIAFFSQGFDSSDYWRLDVWTGVAFKTTYAGRLVMPDFELSAQHFLLLDSSSDFSNISVLNPETQQLSFLGSYWTRHNSLRMAGDYIFLMDYANHWTWIDILSSEMTDFGEYPNLYNLRVSPDGAWLAGSNGSNWLFINLMDGNSYEIEGYFWIDWSPDSQWYIADNAESISVRSTENGNHHPDMPISFPAENASWSNDGQSIFYVEDRHLASVSLADGHVSEYPVSLGWYNPDCIAPNDVYFMVSDEGLEKLVSVESGEIIWQIKAEAGRIPNCLWSDDSHYLISHFIDINFRGASSPNDKWERFFVIDTQTGANWELPVDALSSFPMLHTPD